MVSPAYNLIKNKIKTRQLTVWNPTLYVPPPTDQLALLFLPEHVGRRHLPLAFPVSTTLPNGPDNFGQALSYEMFTKQGSHTLQ